MELLTLILIAFIVGLVIKDKSDNTAETVKKGCGCIITILLICFVVMAIATALGKGG